MVIRGKFVLDRSPPHICALESTDNGFYTAVLPYAVFHAAGCTLGIGIFWLLIKARKHAIACMYMYTVLGMQFGHACKKVVLKYT